MLETCKQNKEGHKEMKCIHCCLNDTSKQIIFRVRVFVAIALLICFLLLVVNHANAQTTVSTTILCTNQNFQLSEVCMAPPETFYVTEQGEAFGTTTSQIPFSQTNILNETTRLQEFRLQEAFWYISDKGTFFADNPLQALSKYLVI